MEYRSLIDDDDEIPLTDESSAVDPGQMLPGDDAGCAYPTLEQLYELEGLPLPKPRSDRERSCVAQPHYSDYGYIERGYIERYDPDQPRDENGRWSETGGNGAGAGTAPKPGTSGSTNDHGPTSTASPWEAGKEPWRLTEREYLEQQSTGHIPDNAYDNYATSEGLSSFITKENYPVLLETRTVKGTSIELRRSQEHLQYVKLDTDGEIVRDARGLAVMMTDQEAIDQGLPIESADIGAFSGDRPVGFASNEFGATGVWVVDEFQHRGLGTALLTRFHQLNPRLANKPMGQMTTAGRALVRAYHRSIVEQAIREGQPVPDRVRAELEELYSKGWCDVEEKFDPDQPRDDHGRWTSTGGGSGTGTGTATQPKPSTGPKPSVTPKPNAPTHTWQSTDIPSVERLGNTSFTSDPAAMAPLVEADLERRGAVLSEEDHALIIAQATDFVNTSQDKGGFTPTHIEKVRRGIEENDTNPVYQRLVSKFGEDTVVVVGKPPYSDPELAKGANAERKNGITLVYNNDRLLRHEPPRPGLITFGTQAGMAAVIRHEYGHHVFDNISDRMREEFFNTGIALDRANPATIFNHISRYASTNPHEGYAELFSMMTDPRWDESKFTPVKPLIDVMHRSWNLEW